MQVKKVFSVDHKQMVPKPPYAKPKYKTYRELLDLDRPKKIIQYESDDENDDFLEKLMKKEERKKKEEKLKEKEKKQSAKSKNISQAASSQKNKKSEPPLEKQNQILSKENSRLASSKSNQNQEVKNIDKNNDIEEIDLSLNGLERKNITQTHEEQEAEGVQQSVTKSSKKQVIKIVVKKKNSSQGNLLSNAKLHSDLKSNTKMNTEDEIYDKILRMSQSQANKIIKNTFFTSHKLRKVDGLQQLQRNVHHSAYKTIHPENLIQTKLNPQKQIIQHTIGPQNFIKENPVSYAEKANNFLLKSAIAPPLEMILMANRSVGNLQSKYKTQMIARKSLFKSNYQEELFLKSLKKQ